MFGKAVGKLAHVKHGYLFSMLPPIHSDSKIAQFNIDKIL